MGKIFIPKPLSLAKDQGHHQLTFWKGEPISYNFIWVQYGEARKKHRSIIHAFSSPNGHSPLQAFACSHGFAWAALYKAGQTSNDCKRKKTKSTTVCISSQKYYAWALQSAASMPTRNLQHSTVRSFTPASPVVGDGRWGGRVSRRGSTSQILPRFCLLANEASWALNNLPRGRQSHNCHMGSGKRMPLSKSGLENTCTNTHAHTQFVLQLHWMATSISSFLNKPLSIPLMQPSR